MPDPITNLNAADGIVPEKTDLTKMEKVLASYRSKRKKLERLFDKAIERKRNANRDVLIRRFQFDADNLHGQIEDLRGKEAWATRMVDTIRMRLHCDSRGAGRLIHNPFAKLALRS